jgi:hypothetical protein
MPRRREGNSEVRGVNENGRRWGARFFVGSETRDYFANACSIRSIAFSRLAMLVA